MVCGTRALRRAGRAAAAAAAEIFGQRRRKSAARLKMRPSPKDSQIFVDNVVKTLSFLSVDSRVTVPPVTYLQHMAHGLHNLIVVDGIGKYGELQELIL